MAIITRADKGSPLTHSEMDNNLIELNGWQSLRSTKPTISIASSVNENTTVSGTISNYDSNGTYDISAVKGSISNINGATFDFTAHDILDDLDTTDTLSIFVAKLGEIKSENATAVLNILVAVTQDTDLVNADFQANENYNDGMEY